MVTFTSIEKWLVVALLVVAVGAFAVELLRRLRFVFQGRAEDRPRLDRLDRRLLTVVKEVLFQSRVVGGRHVVGALHALVFLGFVVFALETVDHFLEPFEVDFLRSLFGSDGLRAFHRVVAVAAALVIVGIVGLAFRRFVLVNYSPDPKSVSSGLVALLIFLLMITYLNSIADPPLLERANWWLHAVIILVFPSLILRSKHFHILLAPVDIFLRTPRLGDFTPLDIDVDAAESEEEITLGLETMKDTPWKMRLDFLTCVECKRCTEQCPAWQAGQELNPRGFILAGRKMLGKEGPVVGNVISERALGQCTSCGACENACPVGIEHLQVLLGSKRAQALATGQGMVAAEFLQTIERHGNPFAASADARTRLIEELGIPLFEPGRTEHLLWLGCVLSYNSDARGTVASLVEVLDRAGVSYGVLETESCSGHHSRRQGEELQFQTLAGENIARFQEHDVDSIIAPCAHCLHTMRREYPTLEEGFAPRVLHHSELLLQLIEQGTLRLDGGAFGDKRVTYHDPCYLGRYEKVFDDPRDVIAGAGYATVELPRRREKSYCCGGGAAGFAREQPEEWRVDQERRREIAESGADVLVTACPECKMMLGTAVEETVDLVELVARSTRGRQGSA